jgi:hypothetical protein
MTVSATRAIAGLPAAGHTSEDAKPLRAWLRERELARVYARALPGRAPRDSGKPIGRIPVQHVANPGRTDWLLSDDWPARVRAISNTDCPSRDACIEDVAQLGWQGMDCRFCPHWRCSDGC